MDAKSTSAAPPWWFLVLLPFLAFPLVFAAFGPALSGKFLEWDDVQGIAQNKDLRLEGKAGLAWRFTTTHMGHYQPLTWWSLSLDVAGAPEGDLGDAQAEQCHRTNLLLHALGAIAFGLLAERLLRAVFKETQSTDRIALAALFASLFWALHPLRVESVAWITERRDVLSAIPLILSLYMYVLWAEGRGAPSWRLRAWDDRWFFLLASWLFLFISLLCKASGMDLPVLLIVLDIFPMRRCAVSWRSILALALEKAPYWVLGVPFAAIALGAQLSEPDAMPSLAQHTMIERLLQASYGLFFYTWKSIVPSGLMPLYEIPKEISLSQARFVVPAILLYVAFVLLGIFRRRVPGTFALAIAATILVMPVLGFAQAGPQLAADRYTYLFGLAFSLLVAGALLQWSRVARWIPCALGAALIVIFVFATRAQAAIWQDNESLWSYVLAREPEHVVGNLSLGNEYARRAFLAKSAPETARGLHEAEKLFITGLNASQDARFASKLALLHTALARLEPDKLAEHQRLASEFSERAVQLAIATGRVSPEVRLQHGIHLLSAGRVEEALKELEWYAGQFPEDPRGKSALDEARARR